MLFTITRVTEDVIIENKGLIWKQIFFSILASFPFFTQSLETTDLTLFRTPSTPPNDVPWSLTARVLAAVLSAPAFCHIIQKYGRKTGVYMVVLAQGLSCIPLFLTPSVITSFILHIITGVSQSGIFITIPIYIREINEHHRALMMTLITVMSAVGHVVRMMVQFEMMMYLMVAMVAVQFLSVLVMVESPSYLVMVGQDEKAAFVMAKLKCLNQNEPGVTRRIDFLKNESQRAKEKDNLSLRGIMKNLIWRDIAVIGLMLYTITTLCGRIIFLDHRKILMQLKLEKYPDDVLVYAFLLAGAVFCFVSISFMERRILITLGYCIMVLSMGVLAVYTQVDLTISYLRWLPFVCLGLLLFSYGLVKYLPLVVMTEMINLEIRTTIIGFLYIYSQVLYLIHEHTFKYIEDYVGIYTTLYIFVGINLYGLVYFLFRLPDIKNKNVRQIEKQMKRIPLFDF